MYKEFVINYNDGRGKMTLILDKFFERRPGGGKFINTTKPDIYKVFKLVDRWCTDEQVNDLLTWLYAHDCADLVRYYTEKYQRKHDE